MFNFFCVYNDFAKLCVLEMYLASRIQELGLWQLQVA